LEPPMAVSDGRLQTAISDSQGEYRFLERVNAGAYVIKASAEGFVSQEYSRDATLEGEFHRVDASTRLRGIDFQLKREAVIRGVLTDGEGKPAGAGISVAAVRKEKRENGSDWLRAATWAKTDTSGRFVLKKLEADTYFVCVNGPNGFDAFPDAGGWYGETWYGNVNSVEGAFPLALKEGEEQNDVRITVQREQRYRVIIWPSGPEGPPEPDRYEVHIEGRSHTSTHQAGGPYVIPGIPPGHYRLVSIAWRRVEYLGEGDIGFDVADSDVTLHVALGGLGEIQGVAKSDGTNGSVPSGVMIGIESHEGAAQARDVDATGRFVFGRVLPGEYEFKLLKQPTGVVLRSVRCRGAEVTPDSPLRVGDRQKVTDCEVLVDREASATGPEVR